MVPESTSSWRTSSTGENSEWFADQECTITPEEDAAISLDSDMGIEGSEHEQSMRDERTPKDMVTLVSQQHRSTDIVAVPTLQQVLPTKNDESECATTARFGTSVHEERDTRWSEICQRIKVDRSLDEGRQQQLWGVLERYQDVFAWNKGELGCVLWGSML
ncbi:unnamed protein product [Sphagnum tenellum]